MPQRQVNVRSKALSCLFQAFTMASLSALHIQQVDLGVLLLYVHHGAHAQAGCHSSAHLQ